MESTLLVVAVALALGFAWTNGFHDTANAVATSLQTGALTPRVALGLAAVLNGVGSLLGIGVAVVVGQQLVDAPVAHPRQTLVIAAVAAAIGWNLVTWWFGLPSSSSHALIGGIAGAGLVAGLRVDWAQMGVKVLLPMLASPLVGFLAAWLLTVVVVQSIRPARNATVVHRFRLAQTVSASAMALGHGLQDGQKSIGVILLALAAGDGTSPAGVPIWVRICVAAALAAGTAAGGWRIIRTLARRVAPIDPVIGFAAETVAAGVLYVAAGVFGVPVSSTHTVTAAIMGAGSTHGLREIRWLVARRIVVAWLLTPVVAALVAGLLYLILRSVSS